MGNANSEFSYPVSQVQGLLEREIVLAQQNFVLERDMGILKTQMEVNRETHGIEMSEMWRKVEELQNQLQKLQLGVSQTEIQVAQSLAATLEIQKVVEVEKGVRRELQEKSIAIPPAPPVMTPILIMPGIGSGSTPSIKESMPSVPKELNPLGLSMSTQTVEGPKATPKKKLLQFTG
jgi:hypothetical protein